VSQVVLVCIPYAPEGARAGLSLAWVYIASACLGSAAVLLLQMQASVGKAIRRRATEVQGSNKKLGAVMQKSSRKLTLQSLLLCTMLVGSIGMTVLVPALARYAMAIVLAVLNLGFTVSALLNVVVRKSRKLPQPPAAPSTMPPPQRSPLLLHASPVSPSTDRRSKPTEDEPTLEPTLIRSSRVSPRASPRIHPSPDPAPLLPLHPLGPVWPEATALPRHVPVD
jgi:hypothetical protein